MSLHVKTMEAKKNHMKNGKAASTAPTSFEHLAEVKAEFKKITWTPKDELITYTKMVVACTFVFGLLIYFVDIIIQNGLSLIGFFVRIIFG